MSFAKVPAERITGNPNLQSPDMILETGGSHRDCSWQLCLELFRARGGSHQVGKPSNTLDWRITGDFFYSSRGLKHKWFLIIWGSFLLGQNLRVNSSVPLETSLWTPWHLHWGPEWVLVLFLAYAGNGAWEGPPQCTAYWDTGVWVQRSYGLNLEMKAGVFELFIPRYWYCSVRPWNFGRWGFAGWRVWPGWEWAWERSHWVSVFWPKLFASRDSKTSHATLQAPATLDSAASTLTPPLPQ